MTLLKWKPSSSTSSSLAGGSSSKQNNLPLRSKNTDIQGDDPDGGAGNLHNGVADKPSRSDTNTPDLDLQLHPLPSRDALLVKVQPPRQPASNINHVPCDIVLVIDTSGSMGMAAPVVTEEGSEQTGLSILDLTKHAAKTIIATLGPEDRLGLVTFDTNVRVERPLANMTQETKDQTLQKVDEMAPGSATNLWGGLHKALQIFEEAGTSGNVPAIMVLTDGMPNHMCPRKGYVPKIRTLGALPASIHTFGFGYQLRSGLLKSIAEVGSGNYAFIPDAGMIGTVFVHAVANLQNTFATEAILKLSHSRDITIKEAWREDVAQREPHKTKREDGKSITELELPLGNIQFGQSRDMLLRVEGLTRLQALQEKGNSRIDATLVYRKSNLDTSGIKSGAGDAQKSVFSLSANVLDPSAISHSEIAYHESRAQICDFLSSLFPLNSEKEHRCIDVATLGQWQSRLQGLIKNLPSQDFNDDLNQSLVRDLAGEEPQGQVSLAVNKEDFFRRWGVHYLPSLLNAHTRQICNSFKDPGPLQYGINSPLFISCRDRLDEAFDNLPAPEPSVTHVLPPQTTAHGLPRASVSMARYNRSYGPCFAGSTQIELAKGGAMPIRKLRRGMEVRTPAGPRKVVAVLKTPVDSETMCRVGDVVVTPWHPMSPNGRTWEFPAKIQGHRPVKYTGAVFSVQLAPGRDSRGHALRVGRAWWGVTLGHGVTSGGDVRAHSFLGDYARVSRSLDTLGVRKNGRVVSGGVIRDERSGTVCGFQQRGQRV